MKSIENNIVSSTDSVKDEIINLKVTVIRNLQEKLRF